MSGNFVLKHAKKGRDISMTLLIEFVGICQGESIARLSRAVQVASILLFSSFSFFFFTRRNYPSKRLLDTTGVWKFSENRPSNSVNGKTRGTEKKGCLRVREGERNERWMMKGRRGWRRTTVIAILTPI